MLRLMLALALLVALGASNGAVGATAAAAAGDGSCPCPAHPGRTYVLHCDRMILLDDQGLIFVRLTALHSAALDFPISFELMLTQVRMIHRSRYCPLDKTPGQCDKASHAPCKPGGTCPPPAPPGPPGTPECHSVNVDKQMSSEKCVLGKNFGCNATGDSIWISGCRGYFSCDGGPSFECSIDGPGRHYCQCSGMPAPSPPGTPHFHGCVDPVAVKLPYCNTSMSRRERLDDLMSRLSRVDKVNILTPSDPRSDCGGQMGGAAEIGLPPWHWLTEANTNIAADCIGPGKCATLFVGPEGMAASFNRTSWRLKGSVLGTEMRVFNMFGGGGNPPSLTGYGPNINIAR